MQRSAKRVLTALSGVAVMAALFWPVDLQRAALSPSLLARDGALLRAYAAADGQIRLPVARDQVDPVFINMLLAYEDRRFNAHPGVDPFALMRAARQWLIQGHVVSGGSTLTMQVARLLDPAPRTLSNKVLEIWRAIRLEARYSKTDILNLYLRLAPYGGNLAGIRAATLVYFNKEPGHLTPDEAALLVVLPQNPNGFRPDRFPAQAKAARAKVLERLRDKNIISDTAFAAGMAASLPKRRYKLPMMAPHLADFLLATQRGAAPWHSTLDATIQAQLEQRLSRHLSSLSSHATIATLVVENKTRNVLAYVGNADYFGTARAGQVNMVTAMRSPGSTLKPFVYGLVFQEGLAAPETVIRDTLVRFGTYTPSNFNQGFTGDVTLRQALQQSLNIPAVKLLNEIGAQRFLARLKADGGVFKLPERRDAADLPIILGGLGTRLWDVTGLYTGLANGGVIRPIRFLSTVQDDKNSSYAFLTGKAARQVTDILTGSALGEGVMRGPDLKNLAVKTGTSYGYRDAWAMGYTPEYTIGIWIGRPDGTPVPGQVGRSVAVPVLLSVYDALPRFATSWPALPKQDILPASQRRWIGDRILTGTTKAGTSPLLIHYPVDQSTFHIGEMTGRGLKLVAQGGSRPYQWYVNGRPVPLSENGRDFLWQPESTGFYKLTVQDKAGHLKTGTIVVVE